MTKNGKIAIGCGVAGCLGLIVIVIVVLVLGGFTWLMSLAGSSNYNSNYNRNSNYNSNTNSDNTNTNTNSNTNSNSESSSSSAMTEDDKHKLFQAAGITKDPELILRVLRKIGFPNGTGDGYAEFMSGHGDWAKNNVKFIISVLKPEDARAYVDAHIND
jgi:predicted metalloprotease